MRSTAALYSYDCLLSQHGKRPIVAFSSLSTRCIPLHALQLRFQHRNSQADGQPSSQNEAPIHRVAWNSTPHEVHVVKRRSQPLGRVPTREQYLEAKKNLAEVKPVHSSYHPEVPLSPVADPKFIHARNKYKYEKPLPKPDVTEFDRKVASNPYAAMLAEPVRRCIVTDVRLPTSLLIPNTISKHPVTGQPWQVPIFGPRNGLPTCWHLGTTDVVQKLASLNTGAFVRTLSSRWKQYWPPKILTKTVYRKDMDEFIISQMRKNIVLSLKTASEAGGITEDVTSEGGLLWLGDGDIPDCYQGRDFYDLKQILGPSAKDAKDICSNEVVVVTYEPANASLIRWLFRIKGYFPSNQKTSSQTPVEQHSVDDPSENDEEFINPL